LAQHVVQKSAIRVVKNRLIKAFHLFDKEAQTDGEHAEVVFGVVLRLSGFSAQQFNDAAAVFVEQLRVAQDDCLALGWSFGRPCLKTLPG